MAPGYHHRTATTTRRGNRSGYPEHDDFEGLPVRQWRQELVNIEPPSVPTTNQKNDRWAVELPWGMPKDTHLLPPHSQELLRAARSGRLYKRKAPADEEDASDPIESAAPGPTAAAGPSATPGLLPAATVTSGADAEKAEERKVAGSSKAKDGVWVKVWKRVPRNAEVPSNSHLAKRHKNTIILPSKASTASFAGPTVTRVTVRRVDAAGNAYEQTVTVNDDTKLSQIGGEIISTTTIAAPAAVETAAQQQPTPTKRRPPPPPHKKKHKGPGRGRKKKLGVLPIPLPANPNPATTAAGGVPGTTDANAETPVGAEVKPEDSSAANQDTEMADNSQAASDDEEDEDDEGEDGEEGEAKEEGMADDDEGDDAMGDSTEQDVQEDQDQDQEMEDAGDDIRDAIQPSSIEEPTEETPADVETEVITKPHIYPPANPMNPGPAHPGIVHIFPPRQQEGSPLKNVVLQSPTEPKNMNLPNIEEVGNSEAPITAPGSSTQPATTAPANTGNAPPPEAPKVNPAPPSFNQHHRPGGSHNFLPSLREPPKVPTPPALPAMLRNREMSDDDGGLDLLGGLERELDRQSRTSSAVPDLLTPAGQGSSSYGNTPADNPVLTPGTGEQRSSEENDRQP